MPSSECTFFSYVGKIYDPIGLLPDRIMLGMDNCGVHFFRHVPRECLHSAEFRDIKEIGFSKTTLFFKIKVDRVFHLFIFKSMEVERIRVNLQSNIYLAILRQYSEAHNVDRIGSVNGDIPATKTKLPTLDVAEKHIQDLSKAIEESERIAKQQSLTKVDARQNFLRIPRMLSYFLGLRKIEDPIGLLPDRITLGINTHGVHFFPLVPGEHRHSAEFKDIKRFGSNNISVYLEMNVDGVLHVFQYGTMQGEEICVSLHTHMHKNLRRRCSEARNIARIDSVNGDIPTNSNPPTVDVTEKHVQYLSKALEESERTAKQLSEELNEKQKKEMKMHEELEANFILTSEKQMLEELSSKYNKLMSLHEEQMEDLREIKRKMSKLLNIVGRIG